MLRKYLTFQVQSDIINNVRKVNIIQLANTTPYWGGAHSTVHSQKITDIPTPM